ncbi:MAG: DNA helicase RecQ [Oscillospiraceae bacterium]|nr:DNA helicase RecQ [Oscillospiraceae bacterium]
MTAPKILKQYFGYDEFREGQAEIIGALMSGRDALGVMPTGAGKSLCYQVPSLLLDGITLVVSPLISLMRDQVLALVQNGVPAAYINSTLTDLQWAKAMRGVRQGLYKIVYVAPERLMSPSMLDLARDVQISLVAIDEAHCISQWGQDFRPSYLDIPRFVDALPTRPPVAAFTATATPRVRDDILHTLGLRDPFTLVTGFDRPNLYFEVKQPENKYAALTAYLRGTGGNGIVYCSTRKEVESVTDKLIADGYTAARYHAGLGERERSAAQDDFQYDRVRVIVATNAFGMGIDKSNVRFVIHYNMPQNVESYYQEAGRAGRDGLPADCILLYARKDINTALFLINQSGNADEISRNRQLLNKMERYCETDGCLRRYMLEYFGETDVDDCGNCGSCKGTFSETDATVDAQKVLSHITRLNKLGKHFMFTHTADILLGKSDDFTDLPTFGIMRGATRTYIRALTSRLTTLGYIHDDGFLSVTPTAREVLTGGVTVSVRGKKTREKRERTQKSERKYAVSDVLLDKLKVLRRELADEVGMPAFYIFSDATLVDMCAKHPRTSDEFLEVSGVGQVKLERYGAQFLAVLNGESSGDASADTEPFTAKLFLAKLEFDGEPLQISRVADKFNAVLLRYGAPQVTGQTLNTLMSDAGYLENADGGKLPSDAGRSIGILTVERVNERGAYTQCLFGAAAQRACARLVAASFEE